MKILLANWPPLLIYRDLVTSIVLGSVCEVRIGAKQQPLSRDCPRLQGSLGRVVEDRAKRQMSEGNVPIISTAADASILGQFLGKNPNGYR
jgi:hypothetical protein